MLKSLISNGVPASEMLIPLETLSNEHFIARNLIAKASFGRFHKRVVRASLDKYMLTLDICRDMIYIVR